MRIPGQIASDEARALWQLASEVPAGFQIVELGSFRGRSTLALAYGSYAGQRNRVYAVDPHADYVGPNGGVYGPQDQADLYRHIVRHRLGAIICVVCLASCDAAVAWNEPSVGLLWIDGDHRYEAVKRDMEAWWPFMIASMTG
jgi:hypothetical protein